MEKTIEFIVKNLVNHPEEVQILSETNDDFVNIKILVNDEDMGKVIGKNGKIATAIRTVARALARKDNKRINIKIGND